ncbi:hypothetical protein [Paenibacillus sp. OK076]|uniref:hypothetical protein n=1 Tax=Paenibacillus sp. OK076 TaxID=1884379 RepID=UPI00115FD55E|nr:hypothetical protein [Paenibacillus sp. OK076]
MNESSSKLTNKNKKQGESSTSNATKNDTPNGKNHWNNSPSKKKGKGKNNNKRKEEERRRRVEEERQKSETETGETMKTPKRYGEPPVHQKYKIDKVAERKADEVREWSKEDIQEFSRNTGLNIQDSINLRSHMFLNEYDLPWYDNKGLYYYKSKLTPDSEVVYAFHKALEGNLTLEQKKWFSQLAAHELEEQKLMNMGKDYRNPKAWNGKDGFNPYPPGAHEMAPAQLSLVNSQVIQKGSINFSV